MFNDDGPFLQAGQPEWMEMTCSGFVPRTQFDYHDQLESCLRNPKDKGAIRFSDSGKEALYIRLTFASQPECVFQSMIQHWKLTHPKHVISIHGDSKVEIDLSTNIKNILHEGLVEVGKTTGTWILTGVTNKGTTRYVGESLYRQDPPGKRVICIGIAPWELARNRTYSRTLALNSQHDYFLLVDDESVGAEVVFQRMLGKYLCSQQANCSVPVVCLVVGGGTDIIDTLHDYIVNDNQHRGAIISIVVLEGSGKAADVIVHVYRHALKTVGNFCKIVVSEEKRQDLLRKIQRTFRIENRSEVDALLKKLLQCIEKQDFITILRPESTGDQLALALMAWNRVDTNTMKKNVKNALINSQVDLIKLLLKNGLPIEKCVTKTFLEELYSKEQWKNIDSKIKYYLGGKYHPPYSLHTSEIFNRPFDELLIWSVMTKCQAMAQLVWQQGDGALAKALVVNNIYRAMAIEAYKDDKLDEEVEELWRYADEFGQEAYELLEYCYRKDSRRTQQLLTYEMPNWSYKTCLDIAFTGRNCKFLSHPCAQRVLSDLWLGGLRTRRYTNWKILFLLIFPIFVPLLVFRIPRFLEFKSKEEIKRFRIQRIVNILCREGNHVGDRKLNQNSQSGRGDNEEGVSESGKEPGWKMKLEEFYTAPLTKYLSWSIGYVTFLLVYTYTLLIRTPLTPEWNELYIIAYISTFFLENLRKFKNRKLFPWIWSNWDLFDAIFIVEFYIGMGLRLHKDYLDIGRVFYCLNIAYWYIRILLILRISKFFGPLLTMIRKMMKKMMHFVVLLLVTLMSYGVFRQSLLFPNEEFSWNLVRDIFFKPNFMIYGENFPETIDPPCGNGTSDSTILPCVTGRWLNPIVLTAYLLVVCILMLNLLIAIFNSIFDQVAENSERIWKFSRYGLVMEYRKKPPLPPPLVILSHIYLIFQWCRRWWIRFLYKELWAQLTYYVNIYDIDTAIKYYRIIGDPTFERNSLNDLIREQESKKNQ